MSSPEIRWDVFVSYARQDRAAVGPIVESLRTRGLRVFVDEAAIDDFDSISRVIQDELAGSLVLLAFYSMNYPTRRACQWELTTAYLAGQREGAVQRRVLVINPESESDHVHPVELRDTRHSTQLSGESLPVFAEKVAAHVASLTTPLGQVEALAPVRWLPAPPRLGSLTFLGPLAQLWRLHSGLHPHVAPLFTGRAAASAMVIRGGPGTGKTALAEEYAVRFSAAFPGGVFWLNLDNDPDPMPIYTRQVRTICSALGLSGAGEPDDLLSALAMELGRQSLSCLWVVDGLTAGLPPAQTRLLFGPHPLAATVLTTRGSYPALAAPIDVDDDHLDVQPSQRMQESEDRRAERAAAFDLQVELATRIGLHALPDDAGGLREALASLYTLFGITRGILRRHGPSAGKVSGIALELLNEVLRPFMTRWHTRLAVHEERRSADVGPWEHERQWPAAEQFRAELAGLVAPLRQTATRLAQISGTSLGL